MRSKYTIPSRTSFPIKVPIRNTEYLIFKNPPIIPLLIGIGIIETIVIPIKPNLTTNFFILASNLLRITRSLLVLPIK